MPPKTTIKELNDAINVPWDEEQSQFWELLMSTGQWMNFAFGRRAANDAMTVLYLGALEDRNSNTEPEQAWTDDEPQWRRQLYDAALGDQTEAGFESIDEFFSLCDWQDLWKTYSRYWTSGFGESTIDRIFRLLHVYGGGGVILGWDDQPTFNLSMEAKHRLISEQVERGKRLLELLPENWSKNTTVRSLLTVALARFKLDNAQDLTPAEVAQLGGVDLKTVRNAISQRDERGLMVNENGLVPVDVAVSWLLRGRGFRPSLWIEADDIEFPTSDSERGREQADYVFVPVAQDDTSFLPDCRQGQGYRIGPKGAEQSFDSYYDALDHLNRTTVPYWRRPNQKGNFGIVKGVAWRRVLKPEINRKIEAALGGR